VLQEEEAMQTRVGSTLVFAVVLLGASLASALDVAPPPTAAQGRALYESKCALCHGQDGVPLPMFAKKNAPNFANAAWQKSKTDAQLRKSIVEGVSGTMMRAFGKELKALQADALVAYLRTFVAAKK
jgi:mono/diheme cytochrome c family protein